VIYQVYPRSFADSDGDGVGDLPGITAHLDHIADLGADAVWLSPIYASPGDDNGYDISDYEAIDPQFGTMDDAERLFSRANELGLKVVMDLVVNHTSDEHAWFQDSASARDSDKADWYIWRDPKPGFEGGHPGAEPNNWQSFFSGSTWTWVPEREQYYLHLFSRKQPDLNWENPYVRAEIYRMMNAWLDRGVDGFRMDVINLISKVPGLPDGIAGRNGLASPMPHVVHGPKFVEYLREMREQVFTGRDTHILTVGETPDATPTHARELTHVDSGPLDMVFQFEHVSLDHGASRFDAEPLDLVALKESLGTWQRELAQDGWNSLYFENHDQPRSVSRWGDDGQYWYESATALATTLHLMRGTPYVYQGQEIGMTNSRFGSIGDFRDLETLRYWAANVENGDADPTTVMEGLRARSRDNARTPMQWDSSLHAGFSTGQPWLDANPNADRINVAAQADDPHSVLAFYRQLIGLRHEWPLVVNGGFTMLAPESDRVFAYERELNGEAMVVIVNWSPEHVDVPADCRRDREEWVLGNYREHPQVPAGDPLRPWESRVISVGVPV
jgi:oligo-1,6-glucosidase